MTREQELKLGFYCSTEGQLPEEYRAQLEKANVDVEGLKNPVLILVWAMVCGGLAIDRFLLGDTTKAIIKLVTCGGCGIWTIYDWFTALKRAREYNIKKILGE